MIDRLTAKETWERVGWYIRLKSWKEVPPSMKIPKQDILPIIITLIIAIIILILGIPLGLKVAHLLNR